MACSNFFHIYFYPTPCNKSTWKIKLNSQLAMAEQDFLGSFTSTCCNCQVYTIINVPKYGSWFSLLLRLSLSLLSQLSSLNFSPYPWVCYIGSRAHKNLSRVYWKRWGGLKIAALLPQEEIRISWKNDDKMCLRAPKFPSFESFLFGG